MDFASSAPSNRVVKIISVTRDGPTSETIFCRLPDDRQLPSVFAIGKPKRMSAVPMRMSAQAAMAAPPPVQAPEMAAIIGSLQPSILPIRIDILRS